MRGDQDANTHEIDGQALHINALWPELGRDDSILPRNILEYNYWRRSVLLFPPLRIYVIRKKDRARVQPLTESTTSGTQNIT